jgi:hypothetical protein
MAKTNSIQFKVYTADYFEKERSLRDCRIKKQNKEKQGQRKSNLMIKRSHLPSPSSNLPEDKHLESSLIIPLQKMGLKNILRDEF